MHQLGIKVIVVMIVIMIANFTAYGCIMDLLINTAPCSITSWMLHHGIYIVQLQNYAVLIYVCHMYVHMIRIHLLHIYMRIIRCRQLKAVITQWQNSLDPEVCWFIGTIQS